MFSSFSSCACESISKLTYSSTIALSQGGDGGIGIPLTTVLHKMIGSYLMFPSKHYKSSSKILYWELTLKFIKFIHFHQIHGMSDMNMCICSSPPWKHPLSYVLSSTFHKGAIPSLCPIFKTERMWRGAQGAIMLKILFVVGYRGTFKND